MLSTTPTAKAASASSSSISNTYYYTQAVSRSEELVACARTALKVAKARYAKNQLYHSVADTDDKNDNRPWFLDLNPSDLTLHQQQPQTPRSITNDDNPINTTTRASNMNADQETIEDGLTILRAMDAELMRLEKLVRRRGQTNDPTEEIAWSVQRLERDAQELTEIIRHMVPTTTVVVGQGGQRQRHYKAVQQWFQTVTQQKTVKLKEILQVRGQVLAEQARRRQRFVHAPAASSSLANNVATSSNTAAAANALFSMPPIQPPPPPPPAVVTQPPKALDSSSASAAPTTTTTTQPSSSPSSMQQPQLPQPPSNTNATMNGYPHNSAPPTTTSIPSSQPQSNTHIRTNSTNSSRYSNYGGYGGGGTIPGYGGGVSSTAAARGFYYGGSPGNAATYGGYAATVTGMRQRRGGGGGSNDTHGDAAAAAQQQQQQFLLQQEQQRHTVRRLQEAKMAEKSLAELGTVFGKMSELISQQSETLEKIEDDVEAAMSDVSAGHGEITILYSIKKGNRALILKVFGLLIFFIVFMRFYVR